MVPSPVGEKKMFYDLEHMIWGEDLVGVQPQDRPSQSFPSDSHRRRMNELCPGMRQEGTGT